MSNIRSYKLYAMGILLIALVIFPIARSEAQNLEIPCEVTPFSEKILSEESGDLLTISGNDDNGYLLHSTSENFVEIAVEQSSTILSPQGDWLLFEQSSTDSLIFQLFNLQDQMTYEMTLPAYYHGRISWFGAPRILITRVTALPEFLPLAVVDIPKQEIKHVFPWWAGTILGAEFVGIESDPLLPNTFDGEKYKISPNGNYLLWDEGYPRDESIFYDVTTQEEVLAVSDSDYFMFDPVWSQDSEKLVFMNGKDNIDQYYILGISENTFERISDFNVDDDIHLDIEDGSWSPDKRYLAVRVKPSLSQPGVLHILDTTNRELYSSCFTSLTAFREFDFAWSLDSRFLAFKGILNEETSIYIYDVVENRVYDFGHQDREILGWSITPNQDR